MKLKVKCDVCLNLATHRYEKFRQNLCEECYNKALEHEVPKKERLIHKLSFPVRFTRVSTNLGFYLGQERISPEQYDRFLWKIMAILNDYDKSL